MKKRISLFLILFVLVFSLCSCKPKHEHSYSSSKVEATCTEQGYTVYTCECGETYKDNYVPAKGHSFGEWQVVTEATEEAEGLKERVCACGEKETEVLPKLEHVHKYTSTVVEPTCTEKGYTEHVCACGESYKDAEVPAKGHEFGEWKVVTEATEEAEGLKERACECGEKETEVLPKLEHVHKFGEWQVVTEPTYEKEGLQERTCRCGEKETEVLPKLEVVEGTVIEVGADKEYKTIEEAAAVAKAGDTIKLLAGSYEGGIVITGDITIQGPNAGISPVTDERKDEAIFTGDLVIEGNNVVIDGIKLEGAGRIVGGELGVEGLTIQNVLVTGSTVNQGNISTNAPFYFAPAAGSFFKDIQVISCKAVDYASDRPMYIFCYDIENIVVKDCHFVGNRKNYNDGFKINDDTATFGIRGEVLFEGNYLEGFSQYVIWFRDYSEGTYRILNNTVVNCGQTAGSHALATFVTYKGAADGQVEIEVAYNTNEKSYMLLRVDAGCPAGAVIKANYNKSINSNGSYYIKNASGAQVDALLNYYGEAPQANKFMGVSAYNPYYNTAEEVPAYGSQTETVFSKITYETNGGEVSGETEYLEGVEFALPVPTKEGYVFLGWTFAAESEDYIAAISAEQKGDVTVYAQWKLERLSEVTYDFDGGVSQELYAANGTPVTELVSTSYSGGFWSYYTEHIFIYPQATDPKPIFSERIYVGKNQHSGLYEVKFVQISGQTTAWPEDAEYVITISSSHANYGEHGPKFKKVKEGDIVAFEGVITQASNDAPVTIKFYNEEPANKTLTVTLSNGSELLTGYKYGYHFLGWKDAQGNEYKTSEDIKGDVTLIAQYEAATLVDEITITNKVTELDRFATYQLEWSIAPNDAFEKTVKFKSSDENIATVDEFGLITTHNSGTVTITIISMSLSGKTDSVEFTVYTPAHFEISYETESYVEIGKEIKLNAAYYDKYEAIQDVVWSSITPTIATVDGNGNVTGVAAGKATIRASLKDNAAVYQDFVVTVLTAEQSEAIRFVLDSHVSNIFIRYELGIGAGVPVYYADIIGSVSKMVFNQPFVKNDMFYASANEKNTTWGPMESIEFITVHYTGNMSKGANAYANANYFAGSNDVSIHYATGNDGIYYCTDESKSAWHAGDSGSMDVVGKFQWHDTGVEYKEGEDLLHVEVTASNDGYYEIFGQKTTIKVPTPWNYKDRNTDHILNADGTYSSKAGFSYSFKNRPIESFFNDMGLPVKVENGKYYMGTTWWCYTQVYEGRICSTGGNYNSIGMESCVDLGSDLWLTWHITAQLVADIMIRHDLDITRVHGHHFFAGKDCPQPMLENNLEIWWEFLDLVEAEHTKMSEFEGYEFSMTSNSEYINDKGRVVSQPLTSQVVTYTVTVKNGDKVETIELASILEGRYCK